MGQIQQGTALNFGHLGSTIAVRLANGRTVRAIARSNINAAACTVFTDERGRSFVMGNSPQQTTRIQTTRFTHVQPRVTGEVKVKYAVWIASSGITYTRTENTFRFERVGSPGATGYYLIAEVECRNRTLVTIRGEGLQYNEDLPIDNIQDYALDFVLLQGFTKYRYDGPPPPEGKTKITRSFPGLVNVYNELSFAVAATIDDPIIYVGTFKYNLALQADGETFGSTSVTFAPEPGSFNAIVAPPTFLEPGGTGKLGFVLPKGKHVLFFQATGDDIIYGEGFWEVTIDAIQT